MVGRNWFNKLGIHKKAVYYQHYEPIFGKSLNLFKGNDSGKYTGPADTLKIDSSTTPIFMRARAAPKYRVKTEIDYKI